jgi:Transglycosylase SLT domain
MPIPATLSRATKTARTTTARMTRRQKLSAAVMAAVGASVLAVSVVPGAAQAAASPSHAVSAAQVVGVQHPGSAPTPTAAAATSHTSVAKVNPDLTVKVEAAKKPAAQHAKADLRTKPVASSAPAHQDNLNGWIDQALSIMHKNHIPGSYDSIKRNIIRESAGNPQAINLWDVNAKNGVPSKGLLQVIPPTFSEYHVSGTSKNIYDPVANIVAACNYAADRYGSMDHVNSAY